MDKSDNSILILLGFVIVICLLMSWVLFTDNHTKYLTSKFTDLIDIDPTLSESNVLGLLNRKIYENTRPTYLPPPNPCTRLNNGIPLSDTEFLEYMIPHHQVAVNVAKKVQSTSRNQQILELARKIIWQQNYEITQIHAMLGRLPQPFSQKNIIGHYNRTVYSFYNNLDLMPPLKCDDTMFGGGEHHDLPTITDDTFLSHMVAHHRLGLEMARKQQNTTQNTFIMALLYDLIHDQEAEQVKMQDMLNTYGWQNSQMLSA